MIFGTKVNLRPFSVEDLDYLHRWNNDPEYSGQFEPSDRISREELLKWLSNEKDELWYIIETKDQVKIGQIVGRVKIEKTIEIGYRVIPAARNLGYCTEARQIARAVMQALPEDEIAIANGQYILDNCPLNPKVPTPTMLPTPTSEPTATPTPRPVATPTPSG